MTQNTKLIINVSTKREMIPKYLNLTFEKEGG